VVNGKDTFLMSTVADRTWTSNSKCDEWVKRQRRGCFGGYHGDLWESSHRRVGSKGTDQLSLSVLHFVCVCVCVWIDKSSKWMLWRE
jgi:hypothetical protein